MVKILRNRKKNTRLNFHNLMFLLAKNRYFVVIAFKILKMEFTFTYTLSITTLQATLAIFLAKVKKNLRKSQAQFREKLRN